MHSRPLVVRMYPKMTANAAAVVPNHMEDALARATAGDEAAFADLVRAHQGMVFSLAYHFLHHRALAEELAQEVFLHLYRHVASIQSTSHLTFWLRKVTSHRCIDQTRRRAVRPEVSLDQVPEPAASARQSDPLLARTVRRLVADLPARARLIVTLRYQEDLDPSEIAAILEMPVNTVKSHLQRSLASLRSRLAGAGHGEVQP